MDGTPRLRLSAMMFVQYFIQGSWMVTLPTFLMAAPPDGGLNLTAGQVAMILGTLSIAATVAPLFVGLLADRLFATQRVLAVLHLVGAGLLVGAVVLCGLHREEVAFAFEKHALAESVGDDELWRLLWERNSLRKYVDGPAHYMAPSFFARLPYPQLWQRLGLTGQSVTLLHPAVWGDLDAARQRLAELDTLSRPAVERLRALPDVTATADRAFTPLFLLMLAYALTYLPSQTLTNALALRNLPDPARQFGTVRAVGTVGWAVAGVIVGAYLDAVSTIPLLLAAVSAALMSLFCLALPHTPPAGTAKTFGDAVGLPALRMLGDRSFLAFVLTAVTVTTILSFHNAFTNKYLADRHVPGPAAVQTLAQCAEVAGILLIPLVQGRLGTKRMMLIGLTASCVRFAAFAVGSLPLVLAVGLPMHGICYSFFFIAAAIYIDHHAPRELRSSAQGLFTVISSGLGAFVGNWIAGRVVQFHTVDGVIDWTAVWLVPAAASLAVTVAFALSFGDADPATPTAVAAPLPLPLEG